MPEDVYKILKDIELRIVGLDQQSNKMQEGYFVSYRTIGLPIHKQDFDNPYSPLGTNLEKDIPPSNPSDPANAPKTASAQMDENKIFAAKIAKSQQSYLNAFLLIDDQLRMNNQYAVMPGASKVSDSWYAIITGANGIPMDSVLSDDMKKAYADVMAKLVDKDGNPTPHYQAYMDYEEKYKAKVKAFNRAYANAFADPMKLQSWPMDGVAYQDDVDEATNQWVTFGYKNEIENAINTMAAQGTDPAIALIARSKKRFMNSLIEFATVGEIPYTVMLPNSWYDSDNDDGWYDYTSNDFHAESHYQASSNSYQGAGGFSVGFWSAGASLSHSDTQSSLNIQTSGLEISFKYCAVDVKRPWMDSSLLSLKNWFLMGDYKKNCISDGTMGQELPTGSIQPTFFPSVMTSLILIKDLRIKWDTCADDWNAHTSDTSASAAVAYGPFAVEGSYTHHDEQRNFEAQVDGQSLSVPGIQLLGYVSMINTASPGVDSSQYLKKSTAATAGSGTNP